MENWFKNEILEVAKDVDGFRVLKKEKEEKGENGDPGRRGSRHMEKLFWINFEWRQREKNSKSLEEWMRALVGVEWRVER